MHPRLAIGLVSSHRSGVLGWLFGQNSVEGFASGQVKEGLDW